MIFDEDEAWFAGRVVGLKVDPHRQAVYTDIRQALHGHPFGEARRRQLLAIVDEWAAREAEAFAASRRPTNSEPRVHGAPVRIPPPVKRSRWWLR